MTDVAQLPVVVVGAGPVGLAAAAHLHERGERFLVLEAGGEAGATVRGWGHVQLFSPWSYVVDRVARRLLEPDWVIPDAAAYPRGAELVDAYLAPLAAHPAIAPRLRFGTRVVAVTRLGVDKLSSPGRDRLPFVLVLDTPAGEERLLARAVMDASGTWTTPNPLGSGGLPAAGEATLPEGVLTYRIPDVTGAERDRYAGRTTLVVGAGHSAFNTLLDLARLAEQAPGTRVVWAIRRATPGGLFGGGEADALARRGALGDEVRALIGTGTIQLVPDFRATGVHTAAGKVVVSGVAADGGSRTLPHVDRVVVNTGFRPDLRITSELRLDLDPVVETTPKLAPLIDPSEHSCGTVRPHGVTELAHAAEPGFFTVGMKSYGRAPTFLLPTGYEQVRSVVAALTGDVDAAARVELELPATGACTLGGSGDALPTALAPVHAAAAACCG